jgi:hypothetical protein
VHFIRLNTTLTNNEGDWTFIGVPTWTQDQEGVIYPPVWSYLNFDRDPSQPPNNYAHELAREDFAFLTSQPLEHTDVSVEYKCPYGSVLHGGIVFRAVDSARFYVLDVVDLGRKGHAYKLTLWLQDAAGYRRELASGVAPHSLVPERIVQGGPRSRDEWYHSSPDWVTVRVQASGTFIRVSLDGQIVFDLRDETYPAGYVGLAGRGAISFRHLRVEGIPGEVPGPWTTHEGELPRFFYPSGDQPEGFNAYPAVCHTEDGVTLVTWSHGPRPFSNTSVVLTRSEDEGRTWSQPQYLFGQDGYNSNGLSIFAHRDGTLSCLLGTTSEGEGSDAIPETYVIRSSDRGETWSEPEMFLIAGQPLPEYRDRYGRLSLYSPWIRLSDGTVTMCGYECNAVPGGSVESNAQRLDRSLFFRSMDDGYTWEAPVYFDENNFDHNECMAAETEPGRLVAFMRTLRAPCMWTSISEDGGQSWTRLAQSDISAECPYLLRHSSGALVLFSRGLGAFLRLSFDGGVSWTEGFRISPASPMAGMTEMGDGRVLIVMHEGYRAPGYIRGQFFRVTPSGPEPAA